MNVQEDEELSFAEETAPEVQVGPKLVWKILIVDDEEEVHTVTRFAMRDFSFLDRSLFLISAKSSHEAIELLKKHDDIAVVLLDVVMETEDAGFRVVKFIREETRNSNIRIVLRTGQPGSAPERSVIIDYDINDYKSKTELTSQKLFTTIIGALRSYRDLQRIESNRQGLERIIDASVSIFRLQSVEKFLTGMLMQISSIVGLNSDSVCYISGGIVSTHSNVDVKRLGFLAGIGRYAKEKQTPLENLSDRVVVEIIQKAHDTQQSVFVDGRFAFYFTSKISSFVLYLESINTKDKLDEWNQHLIELFCNNFAVAFDNIVLHKDMEDLNRAYSHFAPSDAIHFLNKKSITEIALGESTQKTIGVFFLDIRNFTNRAEKMSPTECFDFLNSYLAHIGPIVDTYGGVINKYLGDGFVALFEDCDRLAEIITECAIQIVRATHDYNQVRIKSDKNFQNIKIGIGIASGTAILGTMGFRDRFEFTMIGDTVNTASRLESLNKFFDTTILVSGVIANNLSEKMSRRRMGKTKINGKSHSVDVWEIFASDNQELVDLKNASLDRFHQAITYLEDNEQKEKGAEILRELSRLYPGDSPLKKQILRIQPENKHLEDFENAG